MAKAKRKSAMTQLESAARPQSMMEMHEMQVLRPLLGPLLALQGENNLETRRN